MTAKRYNYIRGSRKSYSQEISTVTPGILILLVKLLVKYHLVSSKNSIQTQ